MEITDLEIQISQLQKQIDTILQTSWQAEALISDRQELESQELAYQKLITEQKEIAIAFQTAESKLNTNQENLQLAQTESQKAKQQFDAYIQKNYERTNWSHPRW